MLQAILNKSWRQHSTRHQLYGHLPPVTKTIQVRRTRHAGYCWRTKDELISDVLLWTPAYGQAKAGRPARTYIQQLCEDTGCSPEDLPGAMNDREKWRERVSYIRASGTTWWYICIYICIYTKVSQKFCSTYVCIYFYVSKYGSKSNSLNKAEKQNNPNRWIYCDVKSKLNVSVSITSIRTLILFFQKKNSYQIHSYTTSNMDDFKTISIYENLPIFAYFFKRQEDFCCLLKKSNIFKYLSTCQTRS